VAFVPGVVVAAAVFAFNLLGEGARAATDPFSTLSLSPRAVGSLGRALLAVALLGGLFFGVAEARSTELSFDDALRLAREAVERVEPGDELLAAVVRYRSDSHALAKPQKLNFYFRSRGIFEILRVGFPDADQNAMEVQHDDEDSLDYKTMAPLGSWSMAVPRALALGEDAGGRAFRNSSRSWLARVVLVRQSALPVPTYRVLYSSPNAIADPNVDVLLDATQNGEETPELRRGFATLRAEAALGGPVILIGASANWRASVGASGGFGVDRPVGVRYSFMRAEAASDTRVATVSAGAGSGPVVVGSASVRQAALPAAFDIESVLGAVERQGGAELRATWARQGVSDWSANAFADLRTGSFAIIVTYVQIPGPGFVPFRYDLATGRVERTQ